jgi:flagellar hook-associated protein 1
LGHVFWREIRDQGWLNMIRSSFLGIEIAKSGVLAARAGLDTVSHNISNANTEGYSRQINSQRATYPLAYPGPFVTLRPGTVGTGTEVYQITRVRSQFVEAQIHDEGGVLNRDTVLSEGYTRVENIFNEPSEYALESLMEEFFNAWEDLSNDPESASTRTNLREVATNLTTFVNELDSNLTQEVGYLNSQISERVDRINSLASQVASINKQITQLEGQGVSTQMKANDLKDQRDGYIEEISQIINARVIEHNDGSVSVLAQGHPIVSGDYVNVLGLRPETGNPSKLVVEFANSRIPVAVTSGELQGLIQMRDVEIPALREQVSAMVTAFTNRVNRLHMQGYGLDGSTGRAFFADYEARRVTGDIVLPAGVGLDTTLDDLGVDSGDFFIQGQRFELSSDDVKPGSAITLGTLVGRIEESLTDVRVYIDDSLGFNRLVVGQFNPAQADNTLEAKDGTSNFFEVFGLKNRPVEELPTEPAYQNSLYNFKLNPVINNDLDTIAATGNDGLGYPGPGDNRTALAIADLKNYNKAIANTTFQEFYQSTITVLGSISQNYERAMNSQTLVVEQLESKRQEISGVNLDEEAVNLIKYQKAYEASARAMTAIDEVLDLIVNRLGTVGR